MGKYNGTSKSFKKREDLISALLEFGLNISDLCQKTSIELEMLFYVNFFAEKGEDRLELECSDIEDLRKQYEMYEDDTFVDPNA